jgi:N-acetyl sugar amidotransferase
VKWCNECVIPSTRPNIIIGLDGVCNACRYHKIKSAVIDWKKKKIKLKKIFLGAKKKSKNNYDCLIPVSGGKDSTWQVLECLKYKMTPLAVTYKTPGRNQYGKKNLQNLIKLGVDHIDFTINPKVEAYFTLKTLKKNGSSAIPMHMTIFNMPLKIAKSFNIPLIIWGENSAAEYGTKKIKEIKEKMDKKWINNFGTIDNTNASFWKDSFLNDKKMIAYEETKSINKVQSIFLGEFLKWDPKRILKISKKNGFITPKVSKTGFYNYADIDCDFISIHHYLKWFKFGFTRVFDNLSIEIRNKRISRKKAISIIKKKMKSIEPKSDIKKFCKYVNISYGEFTRIIEKFRNKQIWVKKNNKWRIKNFIIKNYDW